MITDAHTGDVWAHSLDNSSTFVAEYNWCRMRHQTLDVVQVAVADSTCYVANPNLMRSWFFQVQHFDLDTLTGLVVNRCLHLHRCGILPQPADVGLYVDEGRGGQFLGNLAGRIRSR